MCGEEDEKSDEGASTGYLNACCVNLFAIAAQDRGAPFFQTEWRRSQKKKKRVATRKANEHSLTLDF